MTIIVEPMRPEDVVPCLDIIAKAWDAQTAQAAQNDLRAMFLSPRDAPTFYVARDRAPDLSSGLCGLAGHIVSWKNWGILDLCYVAVLPGVRRCGIGTKLVLRCLEDADALDCAVMITTNAPDFYRGFGFVSLDDDLICAGKSNVLMRRRCLSQRAAIALEIGAGIDPLAEGTA